MKIDFLVKGKLSDVFPYFLDLQQYKAVHPLVYQVDQCSEKTFLFYEKLNLLVYTYRFTYTVLLEQVEDLRKVVMYSEVQKGVHLHLTFTFEEQGDYLLIKEEVDLKSSFIVKCLFLPFFKRVHLKMFKEIARRVA